MLNLKNLLAKTYETGKLPKDLTLCLFRQLEDIYDELKFNNQSKFISLEIKNTLEKCGINTKENGIGYIAYL